jgi:hypothetical protein
LTIILPFSRFKLPPNESKLLPTMLITGLWYISKYDNDGNPDILRADKLVYLQYKYDNDGKEFRLNELIKFESTVRFVNDDKFDALNYVIWLEDTSNVCKLLNPDMLKFPVIGLLFNHNCCKLSEPSLTILIIGVPSEYKVVKFGTSWKDNEIGTL